MNVIKLDDFPMNPEQGQVYEIIPDKKRIVASTNRLFNKYPTRYISAVPRFAIKKYSVEDTSWICNFMGQYKFKEMFPKDWYGNGALYDFEDGQLMGPVEYDKLLTYQYGDYMTPPKDADKNAHAAVFEEEGN